MALIEGLGDEVTLVLGGFLLIVVLLLAWISTHTDDIPLIREVGVIVVELRQRHRNRQQNVTEQQAPQEVEISQNSREGTLNASETGDPDSGNGSGRSASGNHNQDSGHPPSVESPPVEPTASSSSSTLQPPFVSSSSITHHQHNQQQQHQQEPKQELGEKKTESSNTSKSENIVEGSDNKETFAGSPSTVGGSESILIPPPSSRSHLSRETDEETLRRRRVQYFETGGSSVFNGNHTNLIGDGEGIASNSNSGAQRLEGIALGDGRTTTSAASVIKPDIIMSSGPTGASDLCDNDKSDNRSEPAVVSESSMPCHSPGEKVIHRHYDASAQERDSFINNDEDNNNDDGDLNSTTSQNVEEGDDSNFLEGSRIRVKLKYMNETQRFVYASPDDTIGDFRRTHFQSELRDDKWVRFIFNGQDLRDDARTLQACNIENNCTMHCLVTTRQRPGDRPGEILMDEEDDSMLGAMMYPLFTVILMIIWYFRFFYRQYFSAMSTVCLIGISFLLGLSYVSSLRNVNEAGNGQQQQHPPSPPPQQQQQPQAATGGSNHPHLD